MKGTNFFSIALFSCLMVMVCSCSNETIVEPTESDMSVWHSARARIALDCVCFDQSGTATRSSSDYSWSDGDVVYLLLTDKNGAKVQAYIEYDGSTQSWGDVMYEGSKSALTCDTERVAEAYFIEGVNSLSSTTLSLSATNAIYCCTSGVYLYPSDGDMTIKVHLRPISGRIRFYGAAGISATISGVMTYSAFSRSTGKFTESTASVNTSVVDTGYTPYIYCSFEDESDPTLVVTTDKIYKAVFNPSLSVLKVGTSGYLDLPTAENHLCWAVCATKVKLNKTLLSLNKGETVILIATVSPEDATDSNLVWTSSDASVATIDDNGKLAGVNEGTATITATLVSDGSKKATCTVVVIDVNGHAYVDLGLPSGTLWATCNVGASSPEESGYYFAWGETTPKYTYDEFSYTYSDNPKTLPLDRDAAHVNWGGSWQMPTQADFQELWSECALTNATMEGKYGFTYGMEVISKVNGNSIFLPLTGVFTETESCFYGYYGYYWSSSLYESEESAFMLHFGRDSHLENNHHNRFYGQCIRPILRGCQNEIGESDDDQPSDNREYAEGHEYVDLDLSSRTMWATCNLGASSPEEYGNYYAWGEIAPKDTYDESNYTYFDNPGTLPLDRDAAHEDWGGGWRMPTRDEFQELYEECTWIWTTMNGRNCYMVRSKANRKFIFLPTAGCSDSVISYPDHNGFYWSSSLFTSDSDASYNLEFLLGGIDPQGLRNRYLGLSIRPVHGR